MKAIKHILTLVIVLIMHSGFSQESKTKKIEPLQIVNTLGQLVDPVTFCAARYYYYPNLEAYFDTQKTEYHYQENGQWNVAEELPQGYRGYSMYNKVSVVIKDYDDDDITQFISIHKKKYPYITKGGLKKMTVNAD